MSAQAKSTINLCSVHEQKELIYVCSTCNDKLICSRCKNTEHNSHTLKDIKTVAKDNLEKYREADNSVRTQYTAVMNALTILNSYKANMEQSIQNAKNGVHEIVDHLQFELKRSADVQKHTVETFASVSSDRKLMDEIRDVEDLLPELCQSHHNLQHMLGAGVSEHEKCQKVLLIEESKRLCEKAAAIMQQTADRSSTIYLSVHSKIAAVSKVIRDVLQQSQPVAVQTVNADDLHPYARDLAFVHMFKIAEASPQTIIRTLHIAEDDCIVAVYGERQLDPPSNKGEPKDTTMLGVFGANGFQKLPKPIELKDERNPVIYTMSNKRVAVFCPKSERKEDVLDLGTFFDKAKLNMKSGYYFKKENRVSLLSKPYKIYRVSTSTENQNKHVLTVSVDSPQQVVGDKEGKTFAIIHQTVVKENKTQKTLKVVEVFSRAQQSGSAANSIGVIGKDMDNFEPVDLCFYQKNSNDESVLLVATCKNILVVNLKDFTALKDTFSLGYWLPDREPLIPTAMTTDRKGQLWVACKGGKVLCWLPLEVVTDQLYSVPVEGEEKAEDETDDEESDSEFDYHEDDPPEVQSSSESASPVSTNDQDTASTDSSSDTQSQKYENYIPQSLNEELKATVEFRKKRILGENMSDSLQKKSVSASASTAATGQLEQEEDDPSYLVPVAPSIPKQLHPPPDPLPSRPPVIGSALGPDQQPQEQQQEELPPPRPPQRSVPKYVPSIPSRRHGVLYQPLEGASSGMSHVYAVCLPSVVQAKKSAAATLPRVSYSPQQQQQMPISQATEAVQHQETLGATFGTRTPQQQQQMTQQTSWPKERQSVQVSGTNEAEKSKPQHGPQKKNPKIAPKPPKYSTAADKSPRDVTPGGDGNVTKLSVKDKAKILGGKLGF